MASNPYVTLLTAEEVPEFAHLVDGHEMFRAYSATAEKLRADLPAAAAGGEVLLGARLKGEPVGLCRLVPRGGFGSGGYVKLLVVRRGATGAGVGAALMDAAEVHVHGYSPHMFLLVNQGNTRAQEFYRKRGYEQVGALPGFAAAGEVELIYHKRLGA